MEPPITICSNRTYLAQLCNMRGVRLAVEVGTDRGIFANEFMMEFTGHEMICIDNYQPYEWIQNRQPDMIAALLSIGKYREKCRLVVGESTDIAKKLPKCYAERVEFVYLDGAHDYESVRRDIHAWWPLVQAPNGILAGHDYTPEDHPGVVRAVNEFVEENGLQLCLLNGEPVVSWFVYKDK